ncbi:MAG: RagB/SusD family nutrient uptake outer membrane protein, partial [Bacteroidetes bacterium]|nr:RagB/SusD family nutrient uptake outer membrane protein [Bacteroidota bacterium]
IAYTINPMQFTADNSPYNYLWASVPGYSEPLYNHIKNCNTLLANVDKVPASAALRSRWRGEAYFLRALFYHNLYCFFGRFVILDKALSPGSNEVFTPRGSDADCLAFMLKDLDSAAALLPYKYTGADVGRATRGAAYALKCRINLYAGKWQEASDAALEVMKPAYGYGLFPDYAGLFQPQNDNNLEVIFDKQYIADISSGQSNLMDWCNAPPNISGRATGINDPSENLVSQYEMKDGTPFDWSNPSMAARPWLNRDPRLEASIVHDSTVYPNIKPVAAGATLVDMKVGSAYNPSSRPSVTGYYMKKFITPGFDFTSSTLNSGQNFIILRYAEVLLNYAEAQFRLGNTEESRKYVNMVRVRNPSNPQMPAIAAADFSWDRYAHERFIELAFEGTRIWDINRWKIGPQTRGTDIYGVQVSGAGNPRTYTKVVVQKAGLDRIFADKMYLFPLPQSEINKYPGKTLEQNTGW